MKKNVRSGRTRRFRPPKQLHKHPIVVPVVTFFVLSVMTFIALVLNRQQVVLPSDSYIVLLNHDKRQQTIPTRAKTVGEFIKNTGIKVAEGDVVEPSADTRIVEDNFRVNVYRAQPVAIFDGNQKTYALSAATTPRSVAKQAGLEVYPEDTVITRPTENFLRDGTLGQQVTIDRATPANLNLYGAAVIVRTHAETVRDLLKEKHVELAKDDTVQPALDTRLTAQTQVFVIRVGTQIASVTENIPMPVETVEDASLSFGATAIRQAGSPGKKLVTYQIELKNGKEVARHPIQEAVVQAPVKQIVARGKTISIPADKESLMTAAGISPSDFGYVNFIVSHEGGWGGTTRYSSSGSGAYGLCQALPGSKMATAGADWATNPVTQLRWCAGYAQGRYGSWASAYNFWLSHHYW